MKNDAHTTTQRNSKKADVLFDEEDPHIAHVRYIGQGAKKSWLSKTVIIPAAFHGSLLLQCLILCLQRRSNENPHQAGKDAIAAENFINHVVKKYKHPQFVPSSILRLYSNHMSNEQHLEPSSVRTTNGLIRNMLGWSIEQTWFKEHETTQKNIVLATYSTPASVPKNSMTDGTFPAMSELVNSKEFDDLELLNSLTHFCLGFLFEYKRQRDILLQNAGVTRELAFAAASTAPELAWQYLYSNDEYYDSVFNAILASKDAILVERLLLYNPRFEKHFISANKPDELHALYEKLKMCVREESGSIRPKRPLSKILCESLSFEQFDIQSVLSPCEAEEICLRWLLAVDRIQQSGQESLMIDDIDITPTHLTINYFKIRSKKKERTSTSHRKKSYNYKILNYYKNLRYKYSVLFPGDTLNSERFLRYNSPFSRKQGRESIAYKPIVFACTESTNIYAKILEEHPEARLFTEYYLALTAQNVALEIKSEQSESDLHNSSQRRNLTANVIAQSRAIVELEKSKTQSPFDRFGASSAAADSTAHTPETAQTVYRTRSRTAHRLGKRSEFLSAVGKLQEEDARKISTLLERTKILEIAEVNETLGWDVGYLKPKDIDDFNRLIDIAEQHGFSCSPLGSLSHSNSNPRERIIIKTPIIAALILSFIDGCKNELKKSSSKERDHSLVLNLVYAKMVLKNFDTRTISEGKAICDEYDFPPAII